jgi:hypothetical protein
MNPEIRIGDDEREAAVRALGDHFAAGRLTKEEFDERSEQAWAARTRSALMPLFADLPRPPGRPTASTDRGSGHERPGRGLGAWLVPVLVIVLAVAVLTHLPLFLLLLVGWLLIVKVGRHRHHHWHAGGPHRGSFR